MRRLMMYATYPIALVVLISPELMAGGQHLCGKELADTLGLVCHGRGFYMESIDERGKQAERLNYKYYRASSYLLYSNIYTSILL